MSQEARPSSLPPFLSPAVESSQRFPILGGKVPLDSPPCPPAGGDMAEWVFARSVGRRVCYLTFFPLCFPSFECFLSRYPSPFSISGMTTSNLIEGCVGFLRCSYPPLYPMSAVFFQGLAETPPNAPPVLSILSVLCGSVIFLGSSFLVFGGSAKNHTLTMTKRLFLGTGLFPSFLLSTFHCLRTHLPLYVPTIGQPTDFLSPRGLYAGFFSLPDFINLHYLLLLHGRHGKRAPRAASSSMAPTFLFFSLLLRSVSFKFAIVRRSVVPIL